MESMAKAGEAITEAGMAPTAAFKLTSLTTVVMIFFRIKKTVICV